MKPFVEIIIIHHEGLENIKNCLDSLKKTKYSNFRTTVLNQDCHDQSSEMIKKRYSWVNLIKSEKNKSFTKANNFLLKKSKAKYCILLNDDTLQDPQWIEKLISFAEKNKNFATLQPKVLSLKNKKMFEYAGAAGGYIDLYGYPICRGRIFDSLERDNGQYNDIVETFWNCGVAMFINMDALKKVGYFDEDFGSYGEEIDLCWRMNLKGYKQFCIPESKVYHLGSGTWGKKERMKQKEYLIHKNHFLMIIKNYSSKSLLYILPAKIFLELITFLAFLFKKPQKSYAILKMFFWILIHPELLIKKHRENKIRIIKDQEIMKKMINKSVALSYYLDKKSKFKDYIKYLPFLR